MKAQAKNRGNLGQEKEFISTAYGAPVMRTVIWVVGVGVIGACLSIVKQFDNQSHVRYCVLLLT